MSEGFGLSPIVSVNYDIAFVRNLKSLWTARIGLDYIPDLENPTPNFTGGTGIFLNDLIRVKRTR